MEQEDATTSGLWTEETRGLLDTLLARLVEKEKQLNDKERQVSVKENRMTSLCNSSIL